MRLEQGDLFEQGRAGWIRENLPRYETVWSAFIGHDSRGGPLPIPGLSEDEQIQRKRFYQAHYSFAVSAYNLSRLAEVAARDVSRSMGLEALLDQSERLFLLMAYVGHIRDMFKQMDVALKSHGELYEAFQDFYQRRCHVLHGPRLPMRHDELSWFIPRLAGQNEQPGEWHRLATWDTVDFDPRVYLSDFIGQTYPSGQTSYTGEVGNGRVGG